VKLRWWQLSNSLSRKLCAAAAGVAAGAGDQPFDLLVAADVFVYIGDLQPVLEAAAAVSTDRWVLLHNTVLLRRRQPAALICIDKVCSCSVSRP
jgi:hypothetical protein